MLENILGNKTNIRILRLLSRSPNKYFSMKEIKENTKVGFGNLHEAARILEYNNLIISEKKNCKQFKINMKHGLIKNILSMIDHEQRAFQNIDLELIRILSNLELDIIKSLKNVNKVILFGSIARGAYSQKSDIDIAIIKRKKSHSDKYKIAEIESRYEKKHNRKIQTHIFLDKEFKRSKEKLVKNIIREGVDLNHM